MKFWCKVFLYFGIILSEISCTENLNTRNNEKVNTGTDTTIKAINSSSSGNINLLQNHKRINAKNLGNGKFVYQDEFVSGIDHIIISTYYIDDTLSEEEAWEARQWPIVEKQQITFKVGDSTSSVFDFPAKQIWRKTKKGDKMKAAEVLIENVAFVSGRNEIFFEIVEASALCVGGYCPSYDGLFQLSGQPIYQLFKGKLKDVTLFIGKKPFQKFEFKEGDNPKLDSIYSLRGISKKALNDSWNKRICIGPTCK